MLKASLLLVTFAACSAAIAAELAKPVYPGKTWQQISPADVGMDETALEKARDYALSAGGSGYITRHGKLAIAWGDLRRRYDLKSTTKSIGATALGLAVTDGKIKLADQARKFLPKLGTPPDSNADTGWLEHITILHLATQTAGFEKPGGFGKLLFEPGTAWHYSDGGPNWLADCVTRVYHRDISEMMFERVFTPLEITSDDLAWRRNAYRPRTLDGVERREFGSGVHANVDAMARIGYLYLREGEWNGKRILDKRFVQTASTVIAGIKNVPEHDAKQHGNASAHYGLLWWNNADGAIEDVPRDAFWSWGLYDSLILVIPSLDLVASRAGKSWKRRSKVHYDVLEPFFQPIAAAVKDKQTKVRKPERKTSRPAAIPRSPVIEKIVWAPQESIVRKAKGGDNWPMTWGDDDALYTAYGDGWGFEPKVPKKLSLGFAKVTGSPDRFAGVNIRSPTGEQVGGGASGIKASGLLMIDGVLYMLARNAGNSQLAWSLDRGRTWAWSDWKFKTSFGYPVFLNFGKNYHDARDQYVYIYSPDSASAYRPADRMVLARVEKNRIKQHGEYAFFAGLDADGQPRWTGDITKREAVFYHKQKCYRSGITYNRAIERYLWVQIQPGGDTRYRGGLAIFDAPEPWGPWSEVYRTDRWDVGPGESARFPAKWISDEGRTLHLVFSGDDCFSVRRAQLVLKP